MSFGKYMDLTFFSLLTFSAQGGAALIFQGRNLPVILPSGKLERSPFHSWKCSSVLLIVEQQRAQSKAIQLCVCAQ